MLWTLLQHRLRAYWRTPFRGRRLVSTVLYTVLGLSLAVPLAGTGIFFDDIVGHLTPNANPLLVAARGILPAALALGFSQMITRSGLAVDPRPYQALPVPRSALVGLLSVFALLSLWNAVPLAFVVPVCVEAAFSGAGSAALRFGLGSLGVLAAVTYVVPMLRQALAARPVAAMGAVFLAGGGSGLAFLFGLDPSDPLLNGSGWLFGGIVRGDVLPVIAGVGGLLGIILGHTWWLRGMMVVDRGTDTPLSLGRLGALNSWPRRRPAVQEALLILRLLTRNSLPRFTLLWIYPLYLSMVALNVAVDSMDPIADFGGQSLATWAMGTGMFSLFVAQNLFNYIGEYYPGLTVRPAPVRTRVKGHLLFFIGGAVVLFLLPLPAAIWEPSFLLTHTALFFYNVGVTTPFLLAAAPFARVAIPAHDWKMQKTDFSLTKLGLFWGVAAGAFFPLVLFEDPVHQLYVIGSIGLVSCTAMPLWLRGLTALYCRNRYAMLEGFQASRNEQ